MNWEVELVKKGRKVQSVAWKRGLHFAPYATRKIILSGESRTDWPGFRSL